MEVGGAGGAGEEGVAAGEAGAGDVAGAGGGGAGGAAGLTKRASLSSGSNSILSMKIFWLISSMEAPESISNANCKPPTS